MKPPYAIGSVPSLSGHAVAYRWRSLPRVRRHRASKPQGSSERVLPWQITMDQLIFASLSHTHYWYEVGMLKVPAVSVAGGAAGTGSRKNLKENEGRAVIDELFEGSKNGKLAHGNIKRVAQQFACSRKQVTTMWKRCKEQKDAGIAAPSLRNKRGGNSGRKGIDLEELRDKLRHIPLKNRTIQRAVAAQLGIPHTTPTDNLKKLGLHASHKQTAERRGAPIGMALPVSAEAWAAAHTD